MNEELKLNNQVLVEENGKFKSQEEIVDDTENSTVSEVIFYFILKRLVLGGNKSCRWYVKAQKLEKCKRCRL